MIHVLQIKRLVKQRKELKLFELRPFGSAAKIKRKEMKMTLEETSAGICSVSCLSKIENNLIEVSEKFRIPLAERLGISEYTTLKDFSYERHKDTMIDVFLNHDPYPDHIIKSYENRRDIQVQLIKLGYHVSNQAYDLAESFVPDIKTHIPQLNDDEAALFLYCLHEILYHNGRYYDAYEMLTAVPGKSLENEKIRLLFYKGRLKNAFKLHMISEILNTFSLFSKLCNEMQYHNILNEVQVENLLFEATYQSPKHIKKQIERMCRLDHKIASYIYAISLFHHQEYESLLPYLDNNKSNDDQWLLLKLLTFDQLKKEDQLIPLIQEDFNDESSSALKIVHRHLRYKYIANKEEVLNYLRRDILGVRYISDDYFILNYLLNDTQKMFSERHFYKEAVQVSNKLMPKIKSLQKIKNQQELLSYGA